MRNTNHYNTRDVPKWDLKYDLCGRGDMTIGMFIGIYLFGVLSGMAVVVIAIMVYLNPGGSIEVRCEEDR